MNNQFFLWLTFVAPWPWRKNYVLQNFPKFYSSWFGTSWISGTIMVSSSCWSLLIASLLQKFRIPIVSNLSSFICLYGLILWKNSRFLFLFSFEGSVGVRHSFLPFLMGLFVEGLRELCWLLLLLEERLSLFFFFLCRLCWVLPFGSFLESLLSWDFFLFLKFVQYCGNLKKRFSFWKRFWLTFFLISCSLFPIIQLGCQNDRFHCLL